MASSFMYVSHVHARGRSHIHVHVHTRTHTHTHTRAQQNTKNTDIQEFGWTIGPGSGVAPGLEEGMDGMKKGEVRRIIGTIRSSPLLYRVCVYVYVIVLLCFCLIVWLTG